MIPYAKQEIQDKDLEAVKVALQDESITRGGRVEEFEKALAQACDAQYATVFNSGTSALEAAYGAASANEYDRVFTAANTFVGTVAGALKRGCRLTYVDVDEKTGSLDLDALFDKINTSASRGKEIVVPVHYAGVAIDMQKLNRGIARTDTVVIEDAAHALGSCYPSGEKVGSCAYSEMTVFSFHPAKQLTTGEGGAVLTNDPDLDQKLKRYRNNGIFKGPEMRPWEYEVQNLSGNFHMNDFQAALGISQLSRLDKTVKKRLEIVQAYRDKLKGIESIELLDPAFDKRTSYHLMLVLLDFEKIETPKEKLMEALQEKGIGTQVHYIPLYHHPVPELGTKRLAESYPHTEAFYKKALSLPLHTQMTKKDVERVVKTLKAFC